MESKNTNNLIAVLAIIVVAVALINLYITFMKVSDFNEKLTGYASLGYVNITISSTVSLNLTNSSADFGAGGVNSTCSKATLTTRGKTFPTIVCGNWSAQPASGAYAHGIVIENNGNVNCSLTAGGGTAAAFIGGTGSAYEWNFTLSEAGSCSGGTLTQNIFRTANITATPASLCTEFSPLDAGDEVTLDINITIPTDSNIGVLSDTITITAAA